MAEGIQIKNLPSTTTIKQGDTMTIVQDKQNKQLSLDGFFNKSDLATLSPLENRCDEVKNKIEVDEYSAEITTSQSMSKIGSDDSGVNLHENVLDGAYESCVLKGKTKYIDNDTQEILDTFQDGRNLSLIDVKSPILTNIGKNLFDGEFDLTIASAHAWSKNFIKVLPNTAYIFSHQGTDSVRKVDRTEYYNEKFELIGYQGINNGVTTPNDCHYIKFRYHLMDQDLSKVENTQLEQGTVATAYEPYKTNILSVNGDKIELTENMFEQGAVYFTKGQSFTDATNNTAPNRIRLKTLLNLKPNTTYHVVIDNAYKVGVQLYNDEKSAVSDTGWVSDATFTTKGGEKAVALVVRKLSSTANISVSDFKNIKLQLSEVDKTIVLRSLPDGTCDTLNVETGEYVQKIGERNYQDGDTNSNTLVTDGTKTQYKLSSPITTKVDVQGFPHAYKNGHIQLSSGSAEPSLTPTVTYKVPVSRVGQIASNTKSNLRQTIKLDQLEVLVYQSLINAEYENLLVQNSAESATSFTNLSTNDPKDELYYMLKHLIEENQPVQNMLDKINLFYLYGLLSDEHYFDLLLGGEEDVY